MPAAAVVEAWTGLVRTEQALQAEIEEHLKRAGFPPLAWYDVLLELDSAPDGWLRQSRVQAQTLLAQYNLCRLVDRLERDGLVERRQCTRDGRNNVLVITAEGRSLRRAMWPVYAAAIEEHVGGRLTRAEAQQLAKLLGKLTPA